MTPLPLFDLQPRFDSGVTLTTSDHVRLGNQLARVLAVLGDGRWYSVPALRKAIYATWRIEDPEPSLSAQIRNLKKSKHGGHQIERRRNGNTYEFRLKVTR
jgi:hypothetical protein